MSASKNSHVLSVLRKNLALSQHEIAEMLGCAKATITSIEVGRLKLSESLADRIVAVTGCDKEWLLANDVSVPMPSQALDLGKTAYRSDPHLKIWKADYTYQIYILADAFSRLFCEIRKLEKTSQRDNLEAHLRKEMEVLGKTQTTPGARPLFSAPKDGLRFYKERKISLPRELINLINVDYVIETAPETVRRADEQPMHHLAPRIRKAPQKKKSANLSPG
jgi:transcriptional regulator with XRE-family HTH domain